MIKLKKKRFVYLVYIVVAFCIGILYGHYKFYPIPKIINLKNNIFIKEKEIKENKKIKIVKRINLKPNCKLEKIYDLKINSILFIGHVIMFWSLSVRLDWSWIPLTDHEKLCGSKGDKYRAQVSSLEKAFQNS